MATVGGACRYPGPTADLGQGTAVKNDLGASRAAQVGPTFSWVVVTTSHDDCWRRLKYMRFMFGATLKAWCVSVLAAANMTPPEVSLLVTRLVPSMVPY
jgi:hypothetical protein